MAASTADTKDNEDNDLVNYKYVRGANWTEENIKTLTSWTHTSAVMLDLTRESTMYYRKLLRRSTIINLIFSTVAGTVSLSQFNTSISSYIDTVLKAFFSIASILVALNTGYLKVYQIQERLESTIQLQHSWTLFGSKISSEIQLPVKLRKDALFMIIKMKETYHELIRDHVLINNDIIEKVALRNGLSPQQLTITDMFERVIVEEINRIKVENGEMDDLIGVKVETDPVSDTDTEATPRARRVTQRRSGKFFENKDNRDLRKLNNASTEMRRKVSTLVSNPGSVSIKSRTSYDKDNSQLVNVPSPSSPSSSTKPSYDKTLATKSSQLVIVASQEHNSDSESSTYSKSVRSQDQPEKIGVELNEVD